MTNLKKLTAIALTAATVTVTAGQAAKAYAGAATGSAGHNMLVEAVRGTGIAFKINPAECFANDNTAMGWYWAAKNEMVICQENKREVGREVSWTAEDLDTLRHEAQHLVQDCMAGHVRDGHLGAVYQDPIRVAKSMLSQDMIGWIINDGYRNETDHIKVMELEAFAVAAMNDPMEQVADVQKFCF